jgi:LPXTG-site transpeptidase (sortase) family protein
LPLRQRIKSFIDFRFVLVGFAGALLVAALAGLIPWYSATHNRHPVPDPHSTVTHSTDKPDETKVATTVTYNVAKDQPRSIQLPAIGASGLIQKMGIDQHNAIAVPGNVSVAGWYALGAKPGDTGVSLIDGHVQGKYSPGIFKKLKDLKPGDQLSVIYGDNSVRTFQVVRLTAYSPEDTAKHMLEPTDGIKAQLNLITCDGTYNKATHEYDKRILVITKSLGNT